MRKERRKLPVTKELYLFSFINLIGGSMYGLYYGIFLYRQSFDLRVLVIDGLLVSIATWLGYLIGTSTIRRSGYGRAIRLSFALLMLAAIVTLLVIHRIHLVYPLLAFMRGIPAGIYSAVIDIFLLRELSVKTRGKYLNLNLSAEFIVTIILPFMLGGLISITHGYQAVFMLSALVYSLAFLVPIGKRKKPEVVFNIRDELAVLRRPGIREYNINNALTSGADQLNGLLLAIVPFLLFKSEMSVGSFTSIVAIFAAVISLLNQRTKLHHQVKLGYLGGIGRLLSNTMLCVSWTPWALVLQGMINKAMSPFNDPIAQKLKLENASHILGEDLREKALALNFITATVSLLGKIVALSAFLVILSVNHSGQVSLLRYLLLGYAGWKILNYAWLLGMERRFRPAKTQAA